jgi:hypothetical protein
MKNRLTLETKQLPKGDDLVCDAKSRPWLICDGLESFYHRFRPIWRSGHT